MDCAINFRIETDNQFCLFEFMFEIGGCISNFYINEPFTCSKEKMVRNV